MSLLAHSPKDEARVFAMMIAAYNDESGDKRTFAVSGLIGILPEFVELERLWTLKLEEHCLPEFHAAKCEARLEPFNAYEREQRDLFQRDFCGLIAARKIWGFCTAIWQAAYQERWGEFEVHRVVSAGDFTHPYFLAFQHQIEWLCKQVDNGGFAHNEPIAFVFDQQKEFEGRAKVLYDALLQASGIDYKHRLGNISFDSRFCQISLQAADVWAYESRKYVSDVLINKHPSGARWQFEIFGKTKRFGIRGFPPEQLDELNLLMKNKTADSNIS